MESYKKVVIFDYIVYPGEFMILRSPIFILFLLGLKYKYFASNDKRWITFYHLSNRLRKAMKNKLNFADLKSYKPTEVDKKFSEFILACSESGRLTDDKLSAIMANFRHNILKRKRNG